MKSRNEDLYEPSVVAVVGSRVWVLNNGSISEFNEANGSFIRQIKLGFSATLTPEGMALCGPHLWIVHTDGCSILGLRLERHPHVCHVPMPHLLSDEAPIVNQELLTISGLNGAWGLRTTSNS